MDPELTRQLNFLASCPEGTTTMERKEVRAMLMYTGGNMLACGRLYDIIAKDIGAGVYKVSLKLTHG
jgi:hypothetical protein